MKRAGKTCSFVKCDLSKNNKKSLTKDKNGAILKRKGAWTMKNYLKGCIFGTAMWVYYIVSMLLIFFMVDRLPDGDLFDIIGNSMVYILPVLSGVVIYKCLVSDRIKNYFIKLLGVVTGIIAALAVHGIVAALLPSDNAEGSLGAGVLFAVMLVYSFYSIIIGALVSLIVSIVKAAKRKKP